MPKPVLDGPGVRPCIGQGVTAAMPQHVEVDRHRQLRALADVLDKAVDGIRGEWRIVLAGEDIAAVRVFLSKRRQHPQFVTTDRMNRWLAVLGPADMQRSVPAKFDL